MNSPAGGPARLASGPALEAIYGQITEVAGALTEATAMLPTRCSGWAVCDVLYHQLMDARRALVTFATPAGGEPDTDAVSYWWPFSPVSEPAAAAGAAGPDAAGAARHARHVRIVASAYPLQSLTGEWADTSAAAVRAGRNCPYPVVATQGLALSTDDFIATLVTEATLHYLDLTVGLASAPAPDRGALALVRRTLEGLAGAPLPADWDDVSCALKGTGRMPAGPGDTIRLPLLV